MAIPYYLSAEGARQNAKISEREAFFNRGRSRQAVFLIPVFSRRSMAARTGGDNNWCLTPFIFPRGE
jgi:hypothetical protein